MTRLNSLIKKAEGTIPSANYGYREYGLQTLDFTAQ